MDIAIGVNYGSWSAKEKYKYQVASLQGFAKNC